MGMKFMFVMQDHTDQRMYSVAALSVCAYDDFASCLGVDLIILFCIGLKRACSNNAVDYSVPFLKFLVLAP